MPQQPNSANEYNDDIDLISIAIKIWKEKLSIITATLVFFAAGAAYTFYATPIYSVSAQLNPPPSIELEELRVIDIFYENTSFIYTPDESFLQQQKLVSLIDADASKESDKEEEITTEEVFTLFLDTLSSHSHIKAIGEKNKNTLENTLKIPVNDNFLTNISLYRTIELPNTVKKTNDLAPDSYTITIEGKDRGALKSLLKSDLDSASESVTQKLRQLFLSKLNKEINRGALKREAKISDLKSEITARKLYLHNSRIDNIKDLKDAYQIALELNIEPSNERGQSLYMKGPKILKAEISILERLGKNEFRDDDLRSMEAQLRSLEENSRTEPLEKEKQRLLSQSNNLTFYNYTFESPRAPIAPQKLIIMSLSIILGLMLGLIIVVIKIISQAIKQA